jgi:hypothetical protein
VRVRVEVDGAQPGVACNLLGMIDQRSADPLFIDPAKIAQSSFAAIDSIRDTS